MTPAFTLVIALHAARLAPVHGICERAQIIEAVNCLYYGAQRRALSHRRRK